MEKILNLDLIFGEQDDYFCLLNKEYHYNGETIYLYFYKEINFKFN